MVETDRGFMEAALQAARRAARRGDVPVGAVVVIEERVVARGWNTREARRDFLGHAEVTALRKACRKYGDWRLDGSTVYVSLEPCPMCVGSMLQARVARVVYGAADPRCGAVGSIVNLADYPGMNHHMEVLGGVAATESQALLEEFFRERRKKMSASGEMAELVDRARLEIE